MRFTRTDTDDLGYGVYTGNADDMTNATYRITVWRQDRGQWRWQITYNSGHELPADASFPTTIAARRAAAAWWKQHGHRGIDQVRCLYLGERRTFLANTSERTTKRTAQDRPQ